MHPARRRHCRKQFRLGSSPLRSVVAPVGQTWPKELSMCGPTRSQEGTGSSASQREVPGASLPPLDKFQPRRWFVNDQSAHDGSRVPVDMDSVSRGQSIIQPGRARLAASRRGFSRWRQWAKFIDFSPPTRQNSRHR